MLRPASGTHGVFMICRTVKMVSRDLDLSCQRALSTLSLLYFYPYKCLVHDLLPHFKRRTVLP